MGMPFLAARRAMICAGRQYSGRTVLSAVQCGNFSATTKSGGADESAAAGVSSIVEFTEGA
jgi:hypothetical protein